MSEGTISGVVVHIYIFSVLRKWIHNLIVCLTHSVLLANSAEDKLKIFFLFFLENRI